MPSNNGNLETRLWSAADQLWANSGLKPSEFSTPVLGLIFLRYADWKFSKAQAKIEKTKGKKSRRKVGKTDYQAAGVLYLPEDARFSSLQELTEGDDLSGAVNDAMQAIMDENTELKGTLPKTYKKLDNATLVELVRIMGSSTSMPSKATRSARSTNTSLASSR